jgi:hypothetical protein
MLALRGDKLRLALAGGSICEHNHIRTLCKECRGGSICEHNHIRSTCKLCFGGSICEHYKVRTFCKDCRGGTYCEHGRRKDATPALLESNLELGN